MTKFTRTLAAAAAMLACFTAAQAQETTAFWVNDGQTQLTDAKKLYANMRKAKNVIFFVGDGMGVSTVTAARILQGQMANADGERNSLAFEKLPYLALSKTYSANQQTSDSAPTMTAMIAGVKTNDGILGVGPEVSRNEPNQAVIDQYKVPSLLQIAETKGYATGVISTARLTHATPAATYAHSSNRNWERNDQVPAPAAATGVKDIAAQLVDNFGAGAIGDGIEVVLGGGRREFTPTTVTSAEGTTGRRTDGRDLAQEFVTKFNGEYVQTKSQFDSFDPASGKRLIGLFEDSHMEYEHDRAGDTGGEPSLAEMTAKAIDVLKRNPKGYVLVVEAGRIDHGHHVGNAYRALTDTIAMSDAVKVAMDKVDMKDTLVVVSADHSHVFTIAGYPKRGNPILGKVVAPGATSPALAADGNPYTTVSYANGLGFRENSNKEDAYGDGLGSQVGRFANLSLVDTTHPNFHQEALVPLSSETHAGEDVAIFAGGPRAHLFHGVREQNYIFHVMKDALGF
ncbi:MAG: alkaline phosphatase [Aquabacterium commune]|uniref:alkaline phosphatase n=1 Tax=Aquabacterium commune TaxID=70586 RepID=UPI003BAEB06D